MDPKIKEAIISKCFAVSGWANMRGHAKLDEDEKTFDRADKALDILIEQLEKLLKDGD